MGGVPSVVRLPLGATGRPAHDANDRRGSFSHQLFSGGVSMTTDHMTVPKFLRSLPPISRLRSFQELRLKSQDYGAERMALLLHYHETLLREVHHRIGNSLQLIASILALDARKVHSQEERRHLEDAHRRILAVATVQRQLQVLGENESFELSSYLETLCTNLTASLVCTTSQTTIEVHCDPATVSARTATDIGLIVTELVINALKHAFGPDGGKGRILVSYEVDGHQWRLTVADDGLGEVAGGGASGGLGSGIVSALVVQLNCRMETSKGIDGRGLSTTINGRNGF